MTIHLVETSEEDSFVAVATFLAGLLNEGQTKTALAETPASLFLNDCEILIREGRVTDFLGRLVSQLDNVYSKCSDKDAECCVNVMIHLVPKAEPAAIPAAATQLARALAVKPEVRGDEKLSALLTLYGVTSVPAAQYPVLLAAIDFAKSSRALAKQLVPALKGRADEWASTWQLPEGQARELYIAIASVMKVAGEKSVAKESLKLLTSALGLVRADDAAGLASAKPYAVQAVQEFIRSPDIYQCDLVDLPAVRQLSADPQQAPLLALLNAMLVGDLQGYERTVTAPLLEQIGVTAEAALGKARMLALLVLATSAAHEELPFATIQQALNVPAEQVEAWIVRAVGKKLLEGRIDAVRGVLTVGRCNYRSFRQGEWALLQRQLAAWRDTLSGAVAAVAKAGPPTGLGARPVRV